MIRLNAPDPMSEVDCWCTDADRENDTWQDYCPRHGDEPDWDLVDKAERERQQSIRAENFPGPVTE